MFRSDLNFYIPGVLNERRVLCFMRKLITMLEYKVLQMIKFIISFSLSSTLELTIVS